MNAENNYKVMPYGAGYDSQFFAKFIPTANLLLIESAIIKRKETNSMEDVLYELAYTE
ncbi:hypothetical protein GCM10026983_03920 [Gracilibacillus alcaliphilus]